MKPAVGRSAGEPHERGIARPTRAQKVGNGLGVLAGLLLIATASVPSLREEKSVSIGGVLFGALGVAACGTNLLRLRTGERTHPRWRAMLSYCVFITGGVYLTIVGITRGGGWLVAGLIGGLCGVLVGTVGLVYQARLK